MIRGLSGLLPSALLLAAGPVSAADPAQPETVHAARCMDSTEGHPRRAILRPEHIAYLRSIKDRIAIAGGIVGSDGKGTIGSQFIYHAASLDEARTLLANDPLARGKVYESCEWASFPTAIGTWVKGGILAPDKPRK